jgi:hypothetical protein
MADLTYKFRRVNTDTPWIVWHAPYAENHFSNTEITECIQPTRDGILTLEGFSGVTVTEPDTVTLTARLTFNTPEQCSNALIWINSQVDRKVLINNKRRSSNAFNILDITIVG